MNLKKLNKNNTKTSLSGNITLPKRTMLKRHLKEEKSIMQHPSLFPTTLLPKFKVDLEEKYPTTDPSVLQIIPKGQIISLSHKGE